MKSIGILIHRLFVMNRRVNMIASKIAELMPGEAIDCLDVGSGSGEVAKEIMNRCPKAKISGVDVKIRPQTFIPVEEYDGSVLPFDDNAFDMVMIVDVLHHCNDPRAMLKECARVSKRWILIKDHVANSRLDRAILSFMDWIGNRMHGVVLPYNYLSSAEWASVFNELSLREIDQVTQLNLYPKPFDFVFGGKLHCLCLLSKESAYV